MSSARAERLVNLVLCLLSTRQYLTAERIRLTVPGYAEAPSDEAFFRMFERDKAELRELGVPLETGRHSAFEAADGYRIPRQDYELGEVDLEPDEAAAVALAARLWDSPELAGAAHGALVKLRAAGVEVDENGTAAGVEPRVQVTEPVFAPLLAAVQAGRVVTFTHRGGPTAPEQVRTVEPWGVVSWRGRWYLVGHDRDRGAPRTFRLSRISEPVTAQGRPGDVHIPAGVDPMKIVQDSVGLPPVIGTARVWVAQGRAHGLLRIGRVLGPHEHGGTPGQLLELDLRSQRTVTRWLAGHGPDIAVLDPPELAASVRRCWQAAAAAHPGRPKSAATTGADTTGAAP